MTIDDIDLMELNKAFATAGSSHCVGRSSTSTRSRETLNPARGGAARARTSVRDDRRPDHVLPCSMSSTRSTARSASRRCASAAVRVWRWSSSILNERPDIAARSGGGARSRGRVGSRARATVPARISRLRRALLRSHPRSTFRTTSSLTRSRTADGDGAVRLLRHAWAARLSAARRAVPRHRRRGAAWTTPRRPRSRSRLG